MGFKERLKEKRAEVLADFAARADRVRRFSLSDGVRLFA